MNKRMIGLLLSGALLAPAAYSQELEPRAYSNLPTGMNFLAVGYAHSHGGLSADPALPLEDAKLALHTGVLAYVRSLDLGGNSGKFDVIAPYSNLSGNATFAGTPVEREVSGFSDPRLRLAVNFYGAPALSLPEFVKQKQDFVAGASVQITPPMGQYDPDRLVNLGSNRWSGKVDTGFSKSFSPFTFDLTAGVTFFTDNDDFYGGQRREQAAIYSAQTNLSYDFGQGVWAALGFTYYWGGQTTINGVDKDDELANSRVGLTLALPIDRYYSLKLNASTGVSTRTGTSFDTLGFVVQYRWGAGL